MLGWLGKGPDVADLIARRKFAKAIEVLKAQLTGEGPDPRVRLQLADVLVLAGLADEAVPILLDLADGYAAEGQAAKAIAILKKIERLTPGRRDVVGKLASLIKDKNRPLRRAGWQPSPEQGERSEAVYTPEEVDAASAAAPKPAKVETDAERIARIRAASWNPSARPDDAEPAMSDEVFRGEVLGVVQGVLAQPLPEPPPAAAGSPAAAEVADSPLFSGFSRDELVAVIGGLRLLSFEPGDIVLTEGDPGDSLFVLTEGTVKAFVRKPGGGQMQVRTMTEGAFFGEISILSGKPRSATVTAATPCELLELDRRTLDEITRDHPRVRDVLEQFYLERAAGES